MKGAWEVKSLSGQLVCGIKGIAQITVAYLYHTHQLNIFPKPWLFIIMPLIMPFLLPRKLLPLPQILFLQLTNSYPPLEPVERSVALGALPWPWPHFSSLCSYKTLDSDHQRRASISNQKGAPTWAGSVTRPPSYCRCPELCLMNCKPGRKGGREEGGEGEKKGRNCTYEGIWWEGTAPSNLLLCN